MGLFNTFNRRDNTNSIAQNNTDLPDIPENIFIEKDKPIEDRIEQKQEHPVQDNSIYILYQFLEKNYEGKGYDDALINPDSSHLQQNLNSLKCDLERTIKKVKTFYEDFITEIDYHIKSRSRNGMIDTVEELMMKKEIAASHVKKVLEIEDDTVNDRGDSQGIMLTYTRGFKNGLAAISHHNILKRKF